MYSYYMVSAAFPNKFSGVKKGLTVIQLVISKTNQFQLSIYATTATRLVFQLQFFIAIVQGCRGMAVNCPFPKWMGYTLIAYMSSFVILFSNFWFHAYSKPKRKVKNSDKKEEDMIKRKTNQFAPSLK